MATFQMKIDGVTVEVEPGTTLLEAARRFGADIPTLCEYPSLKHHPGTCRLCLVKLTRAGVTRLLTSCDTPAHPGDMIDTKSTEVRQARRRQAELLFWDHRKDCGTCDAHGQCELEDLKTRLDLDTSMQGVGAQRTGVTDTSSDALVFKADQCVRCFRCVETCRQIHGIGAISIEGTGCQTRIGFHGDSWKNSRTCITCGQCTKVCPTHAIDVKDEGSLIEEWFQDPQITTVVQIAPASRYALAMEWGVGRGVELERPMIAALKALGADYVMDTRFSADVTIMEEASELLHHVESGHTSTVLTSCCPGWVNYVEKHAPECMGNLSSTRSPQAIFGALVQAWLPSQLPINPKQMRHISVMPCSAKKEERLRDTLKRGEHADVDAVLTVKELVRLLKKHGIDLMALEGQDFDQTLMTQTSSAGQLFASTGGVMEAALRTFTHLIGEPVDAPFIFEDVRGFEKVKETRVNTKRFGELRFAVVHGLRQAEKVLTAIRDGVSPWHFVEVMACPGGCLGGAGSTAPAPIQSQQKMYQMDQASVIKCAHDNPEVQRLYREFLGYPGSPKAYELLHCGYKDRLARVAPPLIETWMSRVTLTDVPPINKHESH